MSITLSCINLALKNACAPSCPSASTVDENGDVSRQHVTLCFCEEYGGLVGEDQSQPWANWTLSVNGDTTTWTFTSLEGVSGDSKCLTFGVSGGPLSYGDVIIAIYDHSGPSPWVSLDDDLSIGVSNRISAPASSALLLESGDYLLLESGDRLLLETA